MSNLKFLMGILFIFVILLSNNVLAVPTCIDLNDVIVQGTIDNDFGLVRYRDGSFSVQKDTILCNNNYTNNYSDVEYIVISANDITLDCNNATFTNEGTNVVGISNKMNNVVIKNCNLVGFTQGIKSTPDEGYLNFSEGVELFSNFIVDPTIEIDYFNTFVTGLSIVRKGNYLFNFVGDKAGGQSYLSIINYTDFSSISEIDLSDFSFDGTSLFSLESECAVLVYDNSRFTKINCDGEQEWVVDYKFTSFTTGYEDFKFTEDPNTNNIIVSSFKGNNLLEIDVDTGDEIKNLTGMYILLGFEDGLLASLKGEMDAEGGVLVYLVKLNTTGLDFVEVSSVLIDQEFGKAETASNYVLDNEYLMVNLNSVEGGYSIDLKRFNETDFSNLSYTLRTTNDYEPSIYFKNDLLYLVQFAYNETVSVNPYFYYAVLDLDLNLISEGNYTPNDQGLENYIHYMYDDEIYVLANLFNYNWKVLGAINESDEFEVLFPTDYYENEETYTSTSYVSDYNYVTTVKSLINADDKTVAMVLSAQQTAEVKLKAPAEPVDSNFSFDFYDVYQNGDYTKMFSYHFTDSEMRNPIKTVYGDGNYYVLASNRAFEVGIRVLKVSLNYYLYAIDGEGTLLWEKEFGASNNIDMIYDDGNVIVSSAPQYGDFEIGISFPTINVTKINGLNGNVIFNTEYSPENIFDNHNISGSERYEVLMNRINSIQLFSEGYLLLIKNEADPGITYIVKTDFNGNVLEDKILTQTYEEEVCEGGWSEVNFGTTVNFIAVSGDGTSLYVANYTSNMGINTLHLYKSSDNGTSWISISPTISSAMGLSWKGIDVSNDGSRILAVHNYVIGLENYVYLTYDGGVTWNSVQPAGNVGYEKVSISDDGNTMLVGFIDGQEMKVYKCTNDCYLSENWYQVRSQSAMYTPSFNSLKVSGDGSTFALSTTESAEGMGTYNYFYLNRSFSAMYLNPPTGEYSYNNWNSYEWDISDLSPWNTIALNLKEIATNNSYLFIYNVTSFNWYNTGLSGLYKWTLSMSGDGQTIFAGRMVGSSYLSTDGGITWEEITLGDSSTINGIVKSDMSNDGGVIFIEGSGSYEDYIYSGAGNCETIEAEGYIPITPTHSVLIGDSLLISNSYDEDSVNYVINITDFSVIKNITNPSVVQIGRFKRSNGFISSISRQRISIDFQSLMNYYRINERDFSFDLLSTLTLGSLTVQEFLPASYGVLLGGYSTHPTYQKATATLSGHYTSKYYDSNLSNVSLQNVNIIAGGDNILIDSINGSMNATGTEITCEDLTCVIEFLGEIGEVYLINNLNVYLSSNLVSFDSDGLNTPVSIRLSKPTGINIHVLYSSDFCTNVDDCTWEILDEIDVTCDLNYCTFIAPNGFSSYTLDSETPSQPPPTETSSGSSSKDDMGIEIVSSICVGETYEFNPYDLDSMKNLTSFEYKLLQPLYGGWEFVSANENVDSITFTPEKEGVHELRVEKGGYRNLAITFVVTSCKEEPILNCEPCKLENYKLIENWPACVCECSVEACPENFELVDDNKGCRCVYIEPEEELIEEEEEEIPIIDEEPVEEIPITEEPVEQEVEQEEMEEENEETDMTGILSRMIILLFLIGIWYKFYFKK